MSEQAQESNSPIISIKDMNKYYGDFHALTDINLDVSIGERIVICGPSGSGKSTLIRCLNRLEAHQSGDITVDGTELHQHMRDIARHDFACTTDHGYNINPYLWNYTAKMLSASDIFSNGKVAGCVDGIY